MVVPLAGPASAAPGATELVSISTSGQQGNNISARFSGPAVNADGQVVAFDSIATTLVTATVSSTSTDPVPGNNSDTETTTINR